MSPNTIAPEEVKFHRLSYADNHGRLFWWKGDLYRGISLEMKDFYHRFLESGVARRLIEKGLLIETGETSFSMPQYPLILKHRLLPFVSYIYEWPSLMIKDAALATLDIAIELAKEGLGLQDAHPWNVLFEAGRPVYVDFGSIVPAWANSMWPAKDEFYRFFVFPLRLMNRGYERIARRLLQDYEQGVLAFEAEALIRDPRACLIEDARSAARAIISKAVQPALRKLISPKPYSNQPSPASRVEFLKALKAEIESIPIEFCKSASANYYDNSFSPPLSPCSEWTAKQQTVYELLREMKSCSLLDMGSGRGWYSQLAAGLGMEVVAFDRDETAVNRFYCDVKKQHLSILPLIMDICEPSAGGQILPSAVDRLKCDAVLALELVHHLVFRRFLTFGKIVELLVMLTKHRLIVEFIPKEDQFVLQWWNPQYGWYTLESFITELRKHFREVVVRPSAPKPRLLLDCEK